MWNTRKHDRDAGGPVLRDPMANPNRNRAQPYTFNFRNRQENNDGNYSNHHDSFRNIASQNLNEGSGQSGGHPLYPPAHNETLFPPAQQAPLFQQSQAPLLPLLGAQAGFGQEPLIPIFPKSIAPPSFSSGNTSFNFQAPAQLQPPFPSLLPIPQDFRNQGHVPFSGASGQSFDNLVEQEQTGQTLNLQPQWSISNVQGKKFNDEVPRVSLHGNNQPQPGYERRPFNTKHQQNFKSTPPGRNNTSYQINAGQGYDGRQNFNRQTSHHQTAPQQTLDLQPQRSMASQYDVEMSSNSMFGESHSTPSSSASFPSSRYQNSWEERPPSFKSHNQQQIPSLLSRNTSLGHNPAMKKKMFENSNKGQSFNQNFQNKQQLPPRASPNVCSNGNNITITPLKSKSGPLLPTPKLIPYPPPPLNPRSSNNSPMALLRNPRGILKNSSTSSSGYSNFVRQGSMSLSNDNSPSAVVPYDDDDDDDEDDIQYVSQVGNSETSSSNMTHDFFSEKMVQHFASTLAGKPLEEQLDGLLKYLVLPADFLATRVSIVRNLHVMLADTFKKCVLQPYGADFIGVGNSDDSVNVFVDLTGKQGSSSQIDSRVIEPMDVTKETLDELLNLIQEDKNHKFFGQIVRRTNFSNSQINLPVISFIHSETKVRCSIRLDNYLLVQESKIIQFLCSLDTRIPSLLALARYWSSVHKVLDTPEEDTKNRFVTLLMLFHLARKKIIPTFAHLQSLSVNREYFNNLEIGFCDDYALVPPNENPVLEDKMVFTLSTLSLLKEFFQLFAKAKLKDEVVSLWKAEFIPKENFSPELDGKVLSPDLRKRYRYGVNGKLHQKRLECGSRLCIQDFQDLSENLTIAIAEYDISKFQIECDNACKKLETIMSSGSSIMDMFVVSEYAS